MVVYSVSSSLYLIITKIIILTILLFYIIIVDNNNNAASSSCITCRAHRQHDDATTMGTPDDEHVPATVTTFDPPLQAATYVKDENAEFIFATEAHLVDEQSRHRSPHPPQRENYGYLLKKKNSWVSLNDSEPSQESTKKTPVKKIVFAGREKNVSQSKL